jgi:hypothetical protein
MIYSNKPDFRAKDRNTYLSVQSFLVWSNLAHNIYHGNYGSTDFPQSLFFCHILSQQQAVKSAVYYIVWASSAAGTDKN